MKRPATPFPGTPCVVRSLVSNIGIIMNQTARSALDELRAHKDNETRGVQERFGVRVDNAIGVRLPDIRRIAKKYRYNHKLAGELWKTGYHEARMLASMVDDPSQVTPKQMDRWVLDFNAWDLCDTVCGNLFDRTPFAYQKAVEWCARKEEFVKRAGFSLIACLAVHDKAADDQPFLSFLRLIENAAEDDRNFVKKAVNWALRQIGKRNTGLRKAAIKTAERIAKRSASSARWIARDALRELNDAKIVQRLIQKQAPDTAG